jgi:hypothetical protein
MLPILAHLASPPENRDQNHQQSTSPHQQIIHKENWIHLGMYFEEHGFLRKYLERQWLWNPKHCIPQPIDVISSQGTEKQVERRENGTSNPLEKSTQKLLNPKVHGCPPKGTKKTKGLFNLHPQRFRLMGSLRIQSVVRA